MAGKMEMPEDAPEQEPSDQEQDLPLGFSAQIERLAPKDLALVQKLVERFNSK